MASETIANGTDKIYHRLDLDNYGFDDVPNADKAEAKAEVAAYLENQILREVNSGTSPVKGEGRFKRLDKDYAVKDKGGRRLSNLENEGDLLETFDVKSEENNSFLRIGHKGSQVPKSDGHNQLSDKAKEWAASTGFPRRRYIPDDNQKFIPKIEKEIRAIIDGYVPEEVIASATPITPVTTPTTEPVSVITTEKTTTVTTDNLFSDDVIEALFIDAARRRGL
jgi:hypothetical protein